MKTVLHSLSTGLIGIIVLGLALNGHYTIPQSFGWVILVAALTGISNGLSN